MFSNVSLTVSIYVLLTIVLPANSLWPISSCSGKHGGARSPKTRPRCRDSSRKGRNKCLFKLKCHRKSAGNNAFSLRDFPNADYIPDVKEDVGTWFRSMRGARHTHLDGYINEFNWRHWIAREHQ